MLSGTSSEQRSGAALASAACTNYDRLRRLRGEAGVSHPSTTKPQARRQAWVTLLTDASYFAGVKALYQSLVESDTEYPLIVMVTASVPGDVLSRLTDLGPELSLRRVEPLPMPAGTGGAPQYACAHFADCWAKLRMWEWEDEFDLLCYLDADMLVLKCMDELLLDGGDGGDCRAVQECFCPVSERRSLCAYLQPPGSPPPWPYFNAGLLVLRPCRALLAHMMRSLAACDLSEFPFAEQDFLNRYFCGQWDALPWTYNASKALYASHRGRGDCCFWDLSKVKNLHYTMAKPWDLKHPCHAGYERLNEIWRVAFVDPAQLARATLKAVLHERKTAREAEKTDD